LVGNIYGAIDILKNAQFIGEEFLELFENFYQDNLESNFSTDLLNEETMDRINTIIEKHEKRTLPQMEL
jgi:hypothetical protein